jgi:non-heme chloroperoxidase
MKAPAHPETGWLQDRLEPLDPSAVRDLESRRRTLADGRQARFVDLGEPDWDTVVFVGGLATSAGAVLLTEFARPLRERLRLRLVCVERNGFGETAFDPALGCDDYASVVLETLEGRQAERFAIVAFSGGGPFAAALAARAPDRLRSLHLAAAAAGAGGQVGLTLSVEQIVRDPGSFWSFPPDSPILRIPGFVETAVAEGRRALASTATAAAAFAHELELLRTTALPDLSAIDVPTYLYWGSADPVVPPDQVAAWQDALGGRALLRLYDGEAHDVQYRHWDRILLDVAGRDEDALGIRAWSVTIQTGDEQ